MEGEEGNVSTWELRVEWRLTDEDKRAEPSKNKRKFSSFFNSLVIEQSLSGMAPRTNHTGDRLVQGEEAGGHGRQVHHPTLAGLPASAVQAGPEVG